MAFYIGQKVVCVDDEPLPNTIWRGGESEAPVRGAIYTITSVHDYRNHPVVWLAEIKRCASAIESYGPLVGYGIDRFRPVVERKTDISALTAILDNPHKKIVAPKKRELVG